MLGRLLEVTGGAQVLADTLIGRFGEHRAPFAPGVAALIFGVPIFFDAGLVVFLPIILTVARRFGGSLLYYALPAAGAFAAMHAIVPPHPGRSTLRMLFRFRIQDRHGGASDRHRDHLGTRQECPGGLSVLLHRGRGGESGMGRRGQVRAVSPGRRLAAVAVIVAGLGVVGCSADGEESKLNGTWKPRSAPGQGLTVEFPSEDSPLVLDDGEFKARDGCNDFTFTGTYEFDGSQFQADVDPFSLAEVECVNGLMAYADLLPRVRSAAVANGRLVLRDADGKLVADFSRMSE